MSKSNIFAEGLVTLVAKERIMYHRINIWFQTIKRKISFASALIFITTAICYLNGQGNDNTITPDPSSDFRTYADSIWAYDFESASLYDSINEADAATLFNDDFAHVQGWTAGIGMTNHVGYTHQKNFSVLNIDALSSGQAEDTRAMRINYRKDDYGMNGAIYDGITHGSGGQIGVQFDAGFSEIYMSYNFMRNPGTSAPDGYWSRANKMPAMNVAGFEGYFNWILHGINSGSSEFTCAEEQTNKSYWYFDAIKKDGKTFNGPEWKDPDNGSTFSWDFSDSAWHNVTIRYVYNTTGNSDGFAEAFVNGRLAHQWNGLKFTDVQEKFNVFGFRYFHGGVSDEFAPSSCSFNDQWLLIDDVYIFKYKSGYGPANHVLSKPGRTLYKLPNFDIGTGKKIERSNRTSEEGTNPRPHTADEIAPSAPTNLQTTGISENTISLRWDPSIDNVGIDRYEIYINGIPMYSTQQPSIAITGLQPNTSFRISVKAYDTSNNSSQQSNEIIVSTIQPDDLAPSRPYNLKVLEVTESTISLKWSPSTDNVGVIKYKFYVNNEERGESAKTNVTIRELQEGLKYLISVSAVDLAGNESPQSPALEVTTMNSDYTLQPLLPTISIVQVQDMAISPSSTTDIGSLGFAELKSFGLEISEKNNPEKETLILQGTNSTEVVHVGRVKRGIQVLYDFSSGDGKIIQDQSNIKPPLDLNISRESLATEWLPGQGLKINENTTINQADSSTRLLKALAATNEITLEAWVKQDEIYQSGPARIIALSGDSVSCAATISHEGNISSYNYISNLITSDTNENVTTTLQTDQRFTSTSLHHIVYIRNNHGHEKIYVNGLELASGTREGEISGWDSEVRLMLGNDITEERPWKGVFYLVAIYNRALNYEEVNNNYEAGVGQIRFSTQLDTLESNIDFELTPFAKTDQGLIFGEARDFFHQNIAITDSLFSFYPNPSDGNVIIIVRNRDENVNEGYLRLADFSGRVHFTQNIDLSEGLLEKSFEINLPSSLQSGFYALIFHLGTRSVAKKLILMR